jgi:hypothetical protein
MRDTYRATKSFAGTSPAFDATVDVGEASDPPTLGSLGELVPRVKGERPTRPERTTTGPAHGRGRATVLPRSGDVLRVTRAASVQFSEPMMFRVIRVHDWQTYDGWVWLDGYQLNAAGDAVERRSIFVRVDGIAGGVA